MCRQAPAGAVAGGARHGQLQEWHRDYAEPEPDHRHICHLMALYPGYQVSLRGTTELAAACRVSPQRRLVNGESQLWDWEGARAMYTTAHVKLEDGEEAYRHHRDMLAKWTAPSLLTASGGENLRHRRQLRRRCRGRRDAAAEPHRRSAPAARPAAVWPMARSRGCARSGLTVDLAWRDGRLLKARLQAAHSADCRLRCAEAVTVVREADAAEVATVADDHGAIRFPTATGETYLVHAQRIAAAETSH